MNRVNFFAWFAIIVGLIVFIGGLNLPYLIGGFYLIAGLMLIFGALYFNKLYSKSKPKEEIRNE